MIKTLGTGLYGNAHLLLIIGTFGWGSNTIISRIAVGEVSPMAFTFLRWVIVAILLVAINHRAMWEAVPVIRQRFWWVFTMSVCGLTLFNGLFYIAAHHTTAIHLGIIQATIPGIILLGMFFVFGITINRLQFIGLIFAFIGVLAVVSKGSLQHLIDLNFNIGDIFILAASILYAGYTIGLRNRPPINGLTLMGFFAIVACITSLPLLALEHAITGILWPGWKGWLIVIFVALYPSFLSQIFYMRSVDIIGPGSAGLYTNLVPIYASILAIVVLGEFFHIHHLVAIILVFTGIYLFEIRKPKL